MARAAALIRTELALKLVKHRPTPHRAPAPSAEGSFAAEMLGVKRMKPSDRLPPSLTLPAPTATPRQQALDDAAVMSELLLDPLHLEDFESGETLSYRGLALTDAVWRKLKRGQFQIQAELDLHGYNRDAARLAVIQFISNCKDRGWRCVRLIHGKGNGSPNSGPVIKRVMDGWLRRRKDVLGFCSARPCDGGTGAIYLLLRAD